MRRLLIPLSVVVAVGLVLSVIGLVATYARLRADPAARAVLEQDQLLEGLAIPAFTLTDQNGQTRTESILDGQVTILDFVFTHCPFACPMMNASMIELTHTLEGTGVRFVSISVDPEHDTPARLKEHAERLAADESRWTFLTGDLDVVRNIIWNALQFELQPDETRTIELPDGSTMTNISHPTRFLLIGPDRKVLGIYNHDFQEEVNKLVRRARLADRALKERAAGRR